MPKKNVTQAPKIFPLQAAICGRVRKARETEGYSLAHVAKITRCSISALKSYEYARVPIRYGFAKTFCAKLNISQKWLATGEGDMWPYSKAIPLRISELIPENLLFSEVYSRVLDHFINNAPKELASLLHEEQSYEMLALKASRLGLGWHDVNNFAIRKLSEELRRVAFGLSPKTLGDFISAVSKLLFQLERQFESDSAEWRRKGEVYRVQLDEEMACAQIDYRLGRIAYPFSKGDATAKKGLQNDTACRISDGVYEKHPETMQIEININIAPRLISARKKSGLTQSEAAKKWGFSIGTLRDWEQERRKPTGLYKERLEKILSEIEATS